MTDPVSLIANPRETWNRLQDILDKITTKLECSGIPVSTSTIEPGEPVGDYACDGHAYVRLIRGHILDPFPQQTLDPKKCKNPGFLVAAGVLRCAPTMDSNAASPPPSAQTQLSHLQVADMSSIYEVLADYRPPGFTGVSEVLVIDTWLPVEPQGGVAGGEWQFWMKSSVLSLCSCPPTSPGDSEGESPGGSDSE